MPNNYEEDLEKEKSENNIAWVALYIASILSALSKVKKTTEKW